MINFKKIFRKVAFLFVFVLCQELSCILLHCFSCFFVGGCCFPMLFGKPHPLKLQIHLTHNRTRNYVIIRKLYPVQSYKSSLSAQKLDLQMYNIIQNNKTFFRFFHKKILPASPKSRIEILHYDMLFLRNTLSLKQCPSETF